MAVRRVVTGVDEDGRSTVVSDARPPHVLRSPGSLAPEVVYVWTTDAIPEAPNVGTDPTRADQEFFPGPTGSRLVIITYPAGFGAEPPDPAVDTLMTSTKPSPSHDRMLMHRTTTIDYGIVLSGEMTMVLDTGAEVTLRAADVIVQNGAVHAWRNASGEPSVVAFVIIGAHDPVTRS
jgi:hypothetical protein